MSLDHKGFVGLFSEPLQRKRIMEVLELWIENFGTVEQTYGNSHHALAHSIKSVTDVIWEKNLQFRVVSGEQFAWIYLTEDRHVIETTGLSTTGQNLLCHDVLTVLDCDEIIDEHNDHRLDELEAQGLM